MDLHPIFVHFPIAFFTLYSALEIIPWSKLQEKVEYFWLKFGILIAGVLSAPVTLMSGDAASEGFEVGKLSRLVETHEALAQLTVIVYVVILVLSGARILTLINHPLIANQPTVNKFVTLLNKINQRYVLAILALIGLILITVTGALGGAIAFGLGVDPLADYFYKLLVN